MMHDSHVTCDSHSTYRVDLQTHSTCSDGTDPPAVLVEKAAAQGVRVLAITDHDSVLGVAEAAQAGARWGVHLVPAIEFSTRHEPERDLQDINILGYGVNPVDATLQDVLQQVIASRVEQKIRQIEKLQSYGVHVPVDEVLALAGGVPGRPHIAQIALKHNPDRFSSIRDVFQAYLATDAPNSTYVPRSFSLRVEETIEVTHAAGGVAVLAHPGIYSRVRDVDGMVRRLAASGLDGIEVCYPYWREARRSLPQASPQETVAHFAALADELGLLTTGGSDYHGQRKPNCLAEAGLTWAQWEALVPHLAGAAPQEEAHGG